jgi:hypothetical protein
MSSDKIDLVMERSIDYLTDFWTTWFESSSFSFGQYIYSFTRPLFVI